MNRRGFLATILAAATAPALVKFESLMRPRILAPILSPVAGYVSNTNDLLLRGISMYSGCDAIDVTFLSDTKQFAYGLVQPLLMELDCITRAYLDTDKSLHVDGIKIPDAYLTETAWIINEPIRAKIIVPYQDGFIINPKTAKLTWE